MAVSIEDVAKRAHVSISTVSRVINGRNIVNVKTRERVEAAINELGYRPNIFARGLMLRKSHILGMVLPDLHGEFYSEVIRGANFKARQAGYHLLVASVDKDDDGRDVLQAVGDQGLVDGVAVMISELDALSKATLSRISVPFVILDGLMDGVTHDTVRIDQRQGTVDLMRHLIRIGVQRLIFVGGRQQNIDTIDRLAACEEVMAEFQLELREEDKYFLDYDYETAYKFASRHVRRWAGPRNLCLCGQRRNGGGSDPGSRCPGRCRTVGLASRRIRRHTLGTDHSTAFDNGPRSHGGHGGRRGGIALPPIGGTKS